MQKKPPFIHWLAFLVGMKTWTILFTCNQIVICVECIGFLRFPLNRLMGRQLAALISDGRKKRIDQYRHGNVIANPITSKPKWNRTICQSKYWMGSDNTITIFPLFDPHCDFSISRCPCIPHKISIMATIRLNAAHEKWGDVFCDRRKS